MNTRLDRNSTLQHLCNTKRNIIAGLPTTIHEQIYHILFQKYFVPSSWCGGFLSLFATLFSFATGSVFFSLCFNLTLVLLFLVFRWFVIFVKVDRCVGVSWCGTVCVITHIKLCKLEKFVVFYLGLKQ